MILVSVGFRGKWKQCGKVEVRLVDRGCLKIGFDDIWRFGVKKRSFRRTVGDDFMGLEHRLYQKAHICAWKQPRPRP